MTQFADTKADFLERRDQLLKELETVEAVLAALNGPAPKYESQAKPKPKSSNGTAPKRRGRLVGTGQRDKQVLEILSRGPKTIKQVSDEIGMQPNYLYRVAKQLESRGLVKHNEGIWTAV